MPWPPTLEQALDAEMPLALTIPDITAHRVIAQGFVTLVGLVFCDPGWAGDGYATPSSHCFHVVSGDVRGAYPRWTVGEASIEVLEHGGPGVRDWNAWVLLQQEHPGWYSREAARAVLQEAGLLSRE